MLKGSGTLVRQAGGGGGGLLNFPPPPGYNGGDPRVYASYPGYQYVEIGGPGIPTVNMTNGLDYFIKITSPITYTSSLASPNHACITLNGGRHVVVVGGDVRIDSGIADGNDKRSETLGFLVHGGTDGGIVHFEGLFIRANNPVTVRTRRTVRIQWCVIEAEHYTPTSNPSHSDMVQVWGAERSVVPCEAIDMHWVTCYTDYTGMGNLTEIYPTNNTTDYINARTWYRHKVDCHPRMENGGYAGAYAYHCDSYTGGDGPGWANFGPYTVFDSEVYAELPLYSSNYARPIDGIVILRSLIPSARFFPYEIKSPAGATLYTSPDEPTGGNAPDDISHAAGNYLTFDRVTPFVNNKWIIGQPPESEGSVAQGLGVFGVTRRVFVPDNSVGMGYEPKGYA